LQPHCVRALVAAATGAGPSAAASTSTAAEGDAGGKLLPEWDFVHKGLPAVIAAPLSELEVVRVTPEWRKSSPACVLPQLPLGACVHFADVDLRKVVCLGGKQADALLQPLLADAHTASVTTADKVSIAEPLSWSYARIPRQAMERSGAREAQAEHAARRSKLLERYHQQQHESTNKSKRSDREKEQRHGRHQGHGESAATAGGGGGSSGETSGRNRRRLDSAASSGTAASGSTSGLPHDTSLAASSTRDLYREYMGISDSDAAYIASLGLSAGGAGYEVGIGDLKDSAQYPSLGPMTGGSAVAETASVPTPSAATSPLLSASSPSSSAQAPASASVSASVPASTATAHAPTSYVKGSFANITSKGYFPSLPPSAPHAASSGGGSGGAGDSGFVSLGSAATAVAAVRASDQPARISGSGKSTSSQSGGAASSWAARSAHSGPVGAGLQRTSSSAPAAQMGVGGPSGSPKLDLGRLLAQQMNKPGGNQRKGR
jgi:hypothetical protein